MIIVLGIQLTRVIQVTINPAVFLASSVALSASKGNTFATNEIAEFNSLCVSQKLPLADIQAY